MSRVGDRCSAEEDVQGAHKVCTSCWSVGLGLQQTQSCCNCYHSSRPPGGRLRYDLWHFVTAVHLARLQARQPAAACFEACQLQQQTAKQRQVCQYTSCITQLAGCNDCFGLPPDCLCRCR
jgi:hypothetical protein